MLLFFCSGDLLFIFDIKKYCCQTNCVSYLFTVLVRLCQFALIAHGSLVFIVWYTGVHVCKLATFFMALGDFVVQLETSGAPFLSAARELRTPWWVALGSGREACGCLGSRLVPRSHRVSSESLIARSCFCSKSLVWTSKEDPVADQCRHRVWLYPS